MAAKKKKPVGLKLRIIRADAYWVDDKPVPVDDVVSVPKAEADKLIRRGIAEVA